MIMTPDRTACPRHRAFAVWARGRELADLLGRPSPERAPHYGSEWVAYAMLAAAVIGTTISAYGMYQSGQYQSSVARYNALVAARQAQYQQQYGQAMFDVMAKEAAGATALAEAQAAMYETQAEAAEQAGALRQAEIRRAGERVQAQVRASIGASGVETEGSPLLVLLDNAAEIRYGVMKDEYRTALDVVGAKSGAGFARGEGEVRAAGLLGEAHLRRFGAGLTAASLLSEAALSRANAGYFRTAGVVVGGGSLLSGIGNIGLNYFRYPTARTPDYTYTRYGP